MTDVGRVVTAKLPHDLVSNLDAAARRAGRSKSWIVRQALAEWLSDEQKRHELTLEALRDVDEGRTIPQAEIERGMRQSRAARAKAGC